MEEVDLDRSGLMGAAVEPAGHTAVNYSFYMQLSMWCISCSGAVVGSLSAV